MAEVFVAKKSYTNEKTGEILPYERLCIGGYVEGVYQTLELKLEKTELLLVKIILASKGEKDEIYTGSATDEQKEEFLNYNNRSNDSDNINLDEE